MRTSLNVLETYGRPRTSDLIGPQKIYNKLYSLELEHINLFRGKMIADKNSGVKVIENEAGLIIEKNPGKQVMDAPPQQMGSTIPLIKQSIKRDLEEISGISSQFAGFAQFAGESGKHSQAMQEGASNNVSDILICFEEYLKDLIELILWNTANYVQVSRLIDITGNEGKTEFYNVVGGETKAGKERSQELSQLKPREMEAKEGPMTIIVPSNAKVTTDVSSWITWSEEEKLNRLIELFRYGIIEDKQTILEALRVGNLSEILERAEEKRVKDQVAQQRTMAFQQGVQPEKKTNEIEVAEFENVAMAKGQDIPSTSDKAPIITKHTMVHTEWTNSDEFKQLPLDRKESVTRHIEGEDIYHKQNRTAT
jgi:hypothetical protein